MVERYASLIDLMDDVARYGHDYKKNGEERLLVYAESGVLIYARKSDNSWEKHRIGF